MAGLRVRRQRSSAGHSSFSLALPSEVARQLDSRVRYRVILNSRGEIVFQPAYRVHEPRVSFADPLPDRRRTEFREGTKSTPIPPGFAEQQNRPRPKPAPDAPPPTPLPEHDAETAATVPPKVPPAAVTPDMPQPLAPDTRLRDLHKPAPPVPTVTEES